MRSSRADMQAKPAWIHDASARQAGLWTGAGAAGRDRDLRILPPLVRQGRERALRSARRFAPGSRKSKTRDHEGQ